MSAPSELPEGRLRNLLERLLPNDLKGEAIRGDLIEEFQAIAERTSEREAIAWYRRQSRRIIWALATGRISRAVHEEGVSLGRTSVWSIFDGIIQDVGYALRRFRKAPGYTAIAVVTIAIGIGANTAIFSVVEAVILRPLPFPEPDRLVQIWQTNPDWLTERGATFNEIEISALAYREYAEHGRTLDGIAYATVPGFIGERAAVGGGEDTDERVGIMAVSPSFFSVLGTEPALGRTFLSEEMGRAGNGRPYLDVVVLSHDLWVRHFGSDPDIIGREISIEAWTTTVVGVLPERAAFPPLSRRGIILPTDVDVYAPLWYPAFDGPARTGRMLLVLGRMAPGRSPEDVRVDLQRIASGLADAYPEIGDGWSIGVTPLQRWAGRVFGAELYILMGIVGFVLLIACVNLAHLLLAMGARRRAELSVRIAIGGSRRRQVQLLLTESLLLSVLGGGLGLVVARAGLSTLLGLVPADVPRAMEAGIDGSVLAFTVVVALATGLFFGLLPALRASDLNLVEGLKGGKPAYANRRYRAASSPLIVVQVALTLMLLLGGGALSKSFFQLRAVDRGYRSENVLAVEVVPGFFRGMPGGLWDRSTNQGVERRWSDLHRVSEEVRSLPGVISIAFGKTPMSGTTGANYIQFRKYEDSWPTEEMTMSNISYVSPEYFEMLGIPIVHGEGLPEWDGVNDWRRYTWSTGSCSPDRAPYCSETAQMRVVVSESFAEAAWPGQDPIGKELGLFDCCWTVAGVARDVSYRGVDDREPDISFNDGNRVYVPDIESSVLVRTAIEPTALVPAIREAVRSIDETLIAEVSTLEGRIYNSLARPRFHMLLGGIFAAVALLLALVGLYGVVAYTVAQRTHEIGIRIAMGAEKQDIRALVIRGGLAPVGLGVALGIAGALVSARMLEALLYGMSALDPALIAGLSAILVLITAAACYMPARRASAVDPMRALSTQ